MRKREKERSRKRLLMLNAIVAMSEASLGLAVMNGGLYIYRPFFYRKYHISHCTINCVLSTCECGYRFGDDLVIWCLAQPGPEA